MKRMMFISVMFLIFSVALFAADALDSDTLTLVISDTLTVGFAKDAKKSAFSDDDLKLKLNKTIFDETGSINTETYNTDKGYATAAVEFYVYWDAFVSENCALYMTVPSSFKSTTTDGTLAVVGDDDTTKINNSNNATILTSGEKLVKAFSSDSFTSGSNRYILAVDITNAKLDQLYKGTLTLVVKANGT